MIRRNRNGLTMIELILVLVIVAIISSLAYPRVQAGIENQRAKKALETMRTISQAVRLYEINKGNLLDAGGASIDLVDLETSSYVNPVEYAPFYQYTVNAANQAAPVTSAFTPNQAASTRTLTLQVICNRAGVVIKGSDGTVTDSGGLFTTAAC